MGYVRDTTAGEIRLEGDDFGAASARYQLPAAPAGAKKMQFVARYCYHGLPAAAEQLGKGWNHSNCFGLGFGPDIPRYPSTPAPPYDAWLPTDFFGWLHAQAPVTDSSWPIDGTPTFATDRISHQSGFYSSSPAGHFAANTYQQAALGHPGGPFYTWRAFMNGLGGTLFRGFDVSPTGTSLHLAVPANRPSGAQANIGWEIWAGENDLTMYARLCLGGKARAGDAMFDVFTDAYRADQYTLHGNVTSNWRSSFNQCHFPRWLKMRCSHPIASMIFFEARVRYFDWANNELET